VAKGLQLLAVGLGHPVRRDHQEFEIRVGLSVQRGKSQLLKGLKAGGHALFAKELFLFFLEDRFEVLVLDVAIGFPVAPANHGKSAYADNRHLSSHTANRALIGECTRFFPARRSASATSAWMVSSVGISHGSSAVRKPCSIRAVRISPKSA